MGNDCSWLVLCLTKHEILRPFWLACRNLGQRSVSTNDLKGAQCGLGLRHHDFNLGELVLTKTPTMAPSRAARSTNRRNTPLSPPKNAGAVAPSEQAAGRRSTRSQSRDISVASNEHSNLASRKLNESKGLRVLETGKDLCTFAFVWGDYQPRVPSYPF
jgi:hypothetical protein